MAITITVRCFFVANIYKQLALKTNAVYIIYSDVARNSQTFYSHDVTGQCPRLSRFLRSIIIQLSISYIHELVYKIVRYFETKLPSVPSKLKYNSSSQFQYDFNRILPSLWNYLFIRRVGIQCRSGGPV